jgi:hypothetical protein
MVLTLLARNLTEPYKGVIPPERHQAMTKQARKTHHIERFNNTGIVNLLPVDVLIGQEGGRAPSVSLPTRPRALSLLPSSGSVEPSLVDRFGRRGGGVAVGNVERGDQRRRETVGRALAI